MKYIFIKIKDNQELVNYLRSRSFTCLGTDEVTGITTLLNDGSLTFAEQEQLNNKVVYTNILTF